MSSLYGTFTHDSLPVSRRTSVLYSPFRQTTPTSAGTVLRFSRGFSRVRASLADDEICSVRSKLRHCAPSLQQVGARMIVEHFLVLNVPAKYIERLVSGLVGHLPDAGALLGGAGEKAAAQAVTGELLLVEARTGGASLDDQRDAVVAEAGRALSLA